VDLREAVALLVPAVTSGATSWADFGAGSGVFTRALAAIVGTAGRVLAIDRDDVALSALEKQNPPPNSAIITTLKADFTALHSIQELSVRALDGALFANALHFVPDPERILGDVVPYIAPQGRVVVVEYDGRPANPWVPHPVSVAKLRKSAEHAGFAKVDLVGQRASAYGGVIYCAALYGVLGTAHTRL
jgi:ubiquinone/menaquinone biosynthesis C-methylase UbiE